MDSILIADLIRHGQFIEIRLADEDLFSLRTLTRFPSLFCRIHQRAETEIICMLDQVFPEYQSVFSNIFAKPQRNPSSIFFTNRFLNSFTKNSAKLLDQLSRQKVGT
ncbi:MAG: IS110 family transposase [Lachnospiraceae bacterium]